MISLPADLEFYTGELERIWMPEQGCSSEVHYLEGSRGRFVLKTGPDADQIRWISAEYRVLELLGDYRSWVPSPVTQWPELGLYLFTYLEGESFLQALQAEDEAGKQLLVSDYGAFLRRLHAWEPPFPRVDDWMAGMLVRADQNIRSGAVADPIRYDFSPFDGANPRG